MPSFQHLQNAWIDDIMILSWDQGILTAMIVQEIALSFKIVPSTIKMSPSAFEIHDGSCICFKTLMMLLSTSKVPSISCHVKEGEPCYVFLNEIIMVHCKIHLIFQFHANAADC